MHKINGLTQKTNPPRTNAIAIDCHRLHTDNESFTCLLTDMPLELLERTFQFVESIKTWITSQNLAEGYQCLPAMAHIGLRIGVIINFTFRSTSAKVFRISNSMWPALVSRDCSHANELDNSYSCFHVSPGDHYVAPFWRSILILATIHILSILNQRQR